MFKLFSPLPSRTMKTLIIKAPAIDVRNIEAARFSLAPWPIMSKDSHDFSIDGGNK